MPRESSDSRTTDGDRDPPRGASPRRDDAGSDDLSRPSAGGPPDQGTPLEVVEAVAETVVVDPTAAGDRVGDLVAIAREHDGEAREAADRVLSAIGALAPVEFEVWVDDLDALARSSDDGLAFLGLRSVAQLAATNPRAAATGLDAALSNLDAPAPDLRRAALAVVAEVGETDPEAVRRADRPVAAGLRDGDPGVRTGAAIAAGRLLAAAPASFPRTADALLDTLDDDHDRVREFAHVALANVALEHPTNVPRKDRAIEALAGTTDRELGLREGATAEAVSGLLSLELGYELDLR